MPTPAISVIMSVYNRAEYLEESVYSILNQTFTDFEFIIVDDASTDDVPKTLARLATKDARLRILTNIENKERSFSRNRAIHAAKAPYIAIMDSDDVCYPERLAKQYAFMEAHPHVALCSAQQEGYENHKLRKLPCSNAEVRASLFFSCSICHPLVIFRRDPVIPYTQGYNEMIPIAEDYDLWIRLAEYKDIHFETLPDILIRMREHPNRNCSIKTVPNEKLSYKFYDIMETIRTRIYQQLGIEQVDHAMHAMLSQAQHTNDEQKLRQCGQWMQTILQANVQKNVYDHDAFATAHNARWAKLCYRSVPTLPKALSIYKEYRPKPTSLIHEMLKTLQISTCKRIRGITRRIKRSLAKQ